MNQPPLPGMGKDAIKGKKKPSVTQPKLPGMGTMKRTKAAKPETPVEKPARAKKLSSMAKLGQEMDQGHLPMYMTAKEMTTHLDMGDAPIALETPFRGKKNALRKRVENRTMNKKLNEARVGKAMNAHSARWNDSDPTFMDSLKEKGYDYNEGGSFPISMRGGSKGIMTNGHHRVAALRHLNSQQFLPLRWNR